jgi:hypothetical protein
VTPAPERVDVRTALARREAQGTCAYCGWTGTSDDVRCPQCGRLWSARRRKGLSRRARRYAIAAAVIGLAGLTAGVIVAVPRIDLSKRHEHARDARALAALYARERATLRAEQRAHHARTAPAGIGAMAARAHVVDALERDITRDAQARVRAGTIKGPVHHTDCEAYPVNVGAPRVPRTSPVGKYQCYVVLRDIARGKERDAGFIGLPFWARATFATGALVWCRTNPRPGERGLQVLGPEVPLPAECDVRV